ncbi:MAG: CDP-alcohol phosphatidyltransferase family protein [Chthoniobacterales bacterium]|nr:CDP-alcohol phosphatidyltransferase family protein [Chthoniobacterales bacterium]
MTAGLDVPDLAPRVEDTYKARDVESALDIYFYRPIGFGLARLFARLRFTPSMVSLLGALTGVLAGHLYFYRDLKLNILGMALHILTNALDNADGQLARLTNRGSLSGAIMDGFADYVVFLSIYIHLSLRYVAEGGSTAVWLLALAAAASHAVQSMTIDHYRNAYLQFVAGKKTADANSSEAVRAAYDKTSWREFWKKLGLRNYLNYTRQQELLAPALLQLRRAMAPGAPSNFAGDYRSRCLPLVKYCNGLATNPRMLLLFAVLFLGHPVWYFGIEITVLNLLLLYVLYRHGGAFRELLARVDCRGSC